MIKLLRQRTQEMGTYIKQDVKEKLDGMCEMFRVDIGSLMSHFQDKKQESDQCLGNVANAVGGRLLENNERNGQEEFLLNKLSDAIVGLIAEMGGSRNNTHAKNSRKTNDNRAENRRRKLG